jgi:hypothetical protein
MFNVLCFASHFSQSVVILVLSQDGCTAVIVSTSSMYVMLMHPATPHCAVCYRIYALCIANYICCLYSSTCLMRPRGCAVPGVAPVYCNRTDQIIRAQVQKQAPKRSNFRT